MATQSYYETGSATAFKSQSLWPYAYTGSIAYNTPSGFGVLTPNYKAVNLFTSADLIKSSSNSFCLSLSRISSSIAQSFLFMDNKSK